MEDLKLRVAGCFQIVFPELSNEAILQASQETLPAWDSIAAITLVNVIEEEFGLEMDFDALADLNTFDRVYQYLDKETTKAR